LDTPNFYNAFNNYTTAGSIKTKLPCGLSPFDVSASHILSLSLVQLEREVGDRCKVDTPNFENVAPNLAPDKFPKPLATTKKGKIAIVSSSRNSLGVKSSPFLSAKRRIPSHAWDHKIDLESIEADATSTAQQSQNRYQSVRQQSTITAPVKDGPKQTSERRVYREEETAEADDTKVPQSASNTAADSAKSAFTGVTKYSAKMRRRLKRKQRKRSTTSSEGNNAAGLHESTSDTEDETLIVLILSKTDNNNLDSANASSRNTIS